MRGFILSALTVLTFLNYSLALPSSGPPALKPRAPCTNPIQRKEWSTATPEEKASYINATLCLATKQSRFNLSTSLYDDFAFVHNELKFQVHGTAQFLPWHRYFVHVYVAALKECGYIGAAMYWDWVKDSDHPASAPIWDSVTGIGGNGTNLGSNGTGPPDPSLRCIDGPFSSLRPAYYADRYQPHCLTRNFMPAKDGRQEMQGWMYNAAVVADVNTNLQFLTFHGALEGAPHGSVHVGIGGDMGPLTSPNDPIFFLHHTQVDRIWWLWQHADEARMPERLNDFSGTELGGKPGTLDTMMPMRGLAPDRRVGDFMSTFTGDLCYTYPK